MSGPIVRKYGFPNFEKIFGERKLEHGVEDEDKKGEDAQPDSEGEHRASGSAKKRSTPKRPAAGK
jgi:hypothetical protein